MEEQSRLLMSHSTGKEQVQVYGLNFVRHTEVIKIHEKNEVHDTLSKGVTQSLRKFQSTLKEQKTSFSSDPIANCSLIESIDMLTEQVEKLLVLLNRVAESVAKYCERVGETDFKTISSFCPKYRGTYLSLLHFFHEYQKNLDGCYSSISKRESRYRWICNVLRKWNVIFGVACTMEKRYTELHGEEKYDFYCVGYSPDLDIESMTFEYAPFYEKVGSMYNTRSRIFHNSYLSFLAGYAQISEKSLIRDTPLWRDMAFSSIGLFYMLAPKRRAKTVVDFGTVSEFKRSGCFYWNIQDDPIVAPFFDFWVLKVVDSSKVFEIVCRGLEYRRDNVCVGMLREMGKKIRSVSAGLRVLIPERKKKKQVVIEITDEKNEDEEGEGEEEKEKEEEEEEEGESDTGLKDIVLEIPATDDDSKVRKVRRRNGGVSIERLLESYRDLTSTSDVPGSVSIRLILPGKLQNPLETRLSNSARTSYPTVSFFKKFFTGYYVKKKRETNTGACIVHFHGGGFISMSSHCHETYTRVWAKKLNIPIFSVDYTNAPERRFPTQLLECYQAYRFVVDNYREVFGVPLRKVFICGDSAGGNLTAAVTMLAIIEKARIPDAIIMSYPTGITAYEPCPSRICGLIDPLVSKPFLELVLSQYPSERSSKVEKSTNAFLSPIVMPDEMYALFPPAYVSVCCLDPLFDDGVTFAKKLDALNNGKVRLNILEGIPHGALNFCDLITQAKDDILEQIKWLKSFM